MIPHSPHALQRQLAGLATLEAAVRTALRRLQVAYPATTQPQCAGELFEVTTARMLAELCHQLLVALDDHRAQVSPRLYTMQRPDQTAWPF